MRSIKNIIRIIIKEIFDNPTMPKDTDIINNFDYILYKFKTKTNEYCISFNKSNNLQPLALSKDEKINKIILSSNSIYYISWGICDSNNISKPIDNIQTNSNEEIYVFNSIFGIIQDFIIKYNPDAMFYKAIKKRKMIYDKMFNKLNLNYIISHGIMNTFLIKKKLL